MTILIRALFAAALIFALGATQAPSKRWYKGNLHTHTTNSDGDSAPDVVARGTRSTGISFWCCPTTTC